MCMCCTEYTECGHTTHHEMLIKYTEQRIIIEMNQLEVLNHCAYMSLNLNKYVFKSHKSNVRDHIIVPYLFDQNILFEPKICVE